ncbi:MAG: hypothetical protein EOM21_20780, partial [Gammaproteobacteria bacterium]|nr:hypothetical protein [Gammaproteobacteria bacterium]
MPNRKFPLPSVTSDIPRDLRQWIERVVDALSKTATTEELEALRLEAAASDAELADEIANPPDPDGSGGDGGGGGGSGGGGPGDPRPCGETQYPTAPTGLRGVGTFTNIKLTWDAPRYCGHAYTKVYGHTVEGGERDDRGRAVELGSAIGSAFYMASPEATKWYFWITHVNDLGQEGPANAIAGTFVETQPNPTYVLGQISGLIAASDLTQELQAPLALIEPNDAALTTAKNDIIDLQNDLSNAWSDIGLIHTEIEGLTGSSEFDEDETYAVGDVVKYDAGAGTGLYRCILEITSTPAPVPTNTTYWEKIGDYASLGEAVAAHALAIDDYGAWIEEYEGVITANAESVEALETAVFDDETGLAATS